MTDAGDVILSLSSFSRDLGHNESQIEKVLRLYSWSGLLLIMFERGLLSHNPPGIHHGDPFPPEWRRTAFMRLMSVKDIWTGIKWELTEVTLYLLKSGWGQSLRPVCSTSLLSSAQLSHLDSGLVTFTAYCWNAVRVARRKHCSYHKSSQSEGLEINKARLGNSTTGSQNFRHTTISWLSLEKYQN